MPSIYLSKELYDKLVKLDRNVNEFVDRAVAEALKKEKEVMKSEIPKDKTT